MFKKIWSYIQWVIGFVFVILVILFTKRETFALDKVQKEKEREAKEKYEKMSDDDVVDSLVNANDIRNTAKTGKAGTNMAGTLSRNRARSPLSRHNSKGVRRQDN